MSFLLTQPTYLRKSQTQGPSIAGLLRSSLLALTGFFIQPLSLQMCKLEPNRRTELSLGRENWSAVSLPLADADTPTPSGTWALSGLGIVQFGFGNLHSNPLFRL
jgi:hypothetical protein